MKLLDMQIGQLDLSIIFKDSISPDTKNQAALCLKLSLKGNNISVDENEREEVTLGWLSVLDRYMQMMQVIMVERKRLVHPQKPKDVCL